MQKCKNRWNPFFSWAKPTSASLQQITHLNIVLLCFLIAHPTLWLHLRGWISTSYYNQNQQFLNIFFCNLKNSAVIPTMHLLSHGAFLLLTIRMLFCSSNGIMDFLEQVAPFFFFFLVNKTYFKKYHKVLFYI